MRVLISGSKGFIGSNLLQTLSGKSYSIHTIDYVDGVDLSIKDNLKDIPSFDVFVHLANLSYVPASYLNPESFYRINYLTTLNALELCRKNNARLIYLSSYLYGVPKYLPVDEDHTLNPINPYSQSKFVSEILCDGYMRDFGVNTIVLRPFNVYGIGQKSKLLIPEIFQQLIDGKKTINLRDASPRRDYVNVIDVANAIKLCIDKGDKSGKYNLCSGVSYSVKEVTDIINSNLKYPVKFIFSESDRPNEVFETVGSFRKFKNEFNWTPEISLEEGLKGIIKKYNL